jgi:hypothetical protein
MKQLLKSMAQNKHTSGAAVIGFICQAVPIFWPDLKPKCDQLFSLAMCYGFARAGDAPKSNEPEKPASKLPMILLLGSLAVFFAGCAVTSPKAKAYLALKDTQTLVASAERAYGDAVVAGRVSAADQVKCDDAITKFHAAFKTAVRAARHDYTAPTPPDLQRLADSLVALISTFAKEPAP